MAAREGAAFEVGERERRSRAARSRAYFGDPRRRASGELRHGALREAVELGEQHRGRGGRVSRRRDHAEPVAREAYFERLVESARGEHRGDSPRPQRLAPASQGLVRVGEHGAVVPAHRAREARDAIEHGRARFDELREAIDARADAVLRVHHVDRGNLFRCGAARVRVVGREGREVEPVRGEQRAKQRVGEAHELGPRAPRAVERLGRVPRVVGPLEERFEERRVGRAKAVDPLLQVSDVVDLGARGAQRFEEPELERRRVLKLVDHDERRGRGHELRVGRPRGPRPERRSSARRCMSSKSSAPRRAFSSA